MLPREDNILQDEVDAVVKLSTDRNMVISKTKMKAILFHPLRIYDFESLISIECGSCIEVVEKQKIFGNIIRSEYICSRPYQRMWVLRRLKALGCPIPELIDILKHQIVSICEGSFAFWDQ